MNKKRNQKPFPAPAVDFGVISTDGLILIEKEGRSRFEADYKTIDP